MPEINYAENDRRMQDNPTEADLKRLASTHYAYGWTRRPWGHWSPEQVAIYNEAYDAARAAAHNVPTGSADL